MNQFTRQQSADFDAGQKVEVDLDRFRSGLTLSSRGARARDAVSFFQRPTLTVSYEELALDPTGRRATWPSSWGWEGRGSRLCKV